MTLTGKRAWTGPSLRPQTLLVTALIPDSSSRTQTDSVRGNVPHLHCSEVVLRPIPTGPVLDSYYTHFFATMALLRDWQKWLKCMPWSMITGGQSQTSLEHRAGPGHTGLSRPKLGSPTFWYSSLDLRAASIWALEVG